MPPQKKSIENRMAGLFAYQKNKRMTSTNKENLSRCKNKVLRRHKSAPCRPVTAAVLGELFNQSTEGYHSNVGSAIVNNNNDEIPDDPVQQEHEPPVMITIIPDTAGATKETPVILRFVYQL